MLNHIATGSLIQLCYLLLRQPNRLACKLHFNASLAVITLIYDHLILRVHLLT